MSIHEPTNEDIHQSLDLIWNALSSYREDCIHGKEYNDEWAKIRTTMAWITEMIKRNYK